MISSRGYIFVAVCGLLLALFIIRKILKRQIREEYAIFWGIFSVVILLFSLWRGGIDILANWLGISYAPALLILFGLIFNIIYLIHLSEVVSKLRAKNNRLTQEFALFQVKKTEAERHQEFENLADDQ